MSQTNEPADPNQTDPGTANPLETAVSTPGTKPLAMTANARPAGPGAEEGDGGSGGG